VSLEGRGFQDRSLKKKFSWSHRLNATHNLASNKGGGGGGVGFCVFVWGGGGGGGGGRREGEQRLSASLES